MKHRLAARLAALAVLATLPALSFGQAAPGKITINVAQPGAKISPTLFGLMTEEINYSYEGGIYGELLPNRSFTGTGGNGGAGRGRGRGAPPADGAAPATPPAPSPAPHWFVHTPAGSQATAALETEDPPIKGALTRALRLDITSASADAPAGVANDGFWGIPVRPDTTYTASLYARAANGFTGPLTASIVGNDGKVYASAKVDITDKWTLKKFTLKTPAGFTPTADAKYIISGASIGSFSITQVSLFPPVFNPRNAAALGERPTTGFRPDILQLLNDMHPAFLRFPGGNYVEGPNIPNRYNFKTTIGAWEDRPGHDGSWGYRSSDGMGFLEFLEWCEDLHMEPLLAVWDGLNLNGGRTVVTGDALKPYIQDALDEIEYVSGDKSTEWGAKRARDGHPEPFALHYVEVGNEDNLNGGTQTYQGPEGRFALFYTAIKAKYPNLQVIATTNPRTTHDIIDNHDYMSPVSAINNAHKYDRVSRTGPKQMEGEWASQEGGLNNGQRPITPTFQCAIADAAFLTGLQRNADIVILSCYAPLFTRTNPGGNNWHTNLIGYDTLTSYGSPSYYTQKMFNNARGDAVLPVAAVTPQQPGANAAAAGFSMDAPFFVGAPAAPAGGPGAGAPGAAGGPGGPGGPGGGRGAGGFGGGGGGRGRGRGAPQTPNPAEPLFACASSEDKTGDIIVKVVNVFPNEQLMQVDLSGAKVLPNGTGEVMAAQPDETNTITDPLHVVPKPFAITDASALWTHTFPGNSITVLRFKTR